MPSKKLVSYIKLVFLTFLIYLIFYFIVFKLLGDEVINISRIIVQGFILALVIPLFNKKFRYSNKKKLEK